MNEPMDRTSIQADPACRVVILVVLALSICGCFGKSTHVKEADAWRKPGPVNSVPSSKAQSVGGGQVHAVKKSKRPLQKLALIVNVSALLGHSVREVEKVVGAEGFNEEKFGPGDAYGFPNGATGWEYWSPVNANGEPVAGAVTFYVNFDTDGKAKEVKFASLGAVRYSLEDWELILARFGMNVNVPPDSRDAQGQNWYNNLPKYHIWMGAGGDGMVNMMTIRFREIRERGEQ